MSVTKEFREHRGHPYSNWQLDVACGDTRRGYEDWAEDRREQAKNEGKGICLVCGNFVEKQESCDSALCTQEPHHLTSLARKITSYWYVTRENRSERGEVLSTFQLRTAWKEGQVIKTFLEKVYDSPGSGWCRTDDYLTNFSDQVCRKCTMPFSEGGDGYDGMCPSCADQDSLRTFTVRWAKTYVHSGVEEVRAIDEGEAKEAVAKKIGDLEGSSQYLPDQDVVEAHEKDESESN